MKWKEIKLILFFFVVKIKNFDASNFTTLKLRELLHLVCFTVDLLMLLMLLFLIDKCSWTFHSVDVMLFRFPVI